MILENQTPSFFNSLPLTSKIASYSLIYYQTKPPEYALTDSMPYNDRFNDTFVDSFNLYAMAKKQGDLSRVGALTRDMFWKRAMEEVIRRNHIQKAYYIDF